MATEHNRFSFMGRKAIQWIFGSRKGEHVARNLHLELMKAYKKLNGLSAQGDHQVNDLLVYTGSFTKGKRTAAVVLRSGTTLRGFYGIGKPAIRAEFQQQEDGNVYVSISIPGGISDKDKEAVDELRDYLQSVQIGSLSHAMAQEHAQVFAIESKIKELVRSSEDSKEIIEWLQRNYEYISSLACRNLKEKEYSDKVIEVLSLPYYADTIDWLRANKALIDDLATEMKVEFISIIKFMTACELTETGGFNKGFDEIFQQLKAAQPAIVALAEKLNISHQEVLDWITESNDPDLYITELASIYEIHVKSSSDHEKASVKDVMGLDYNLFGNDDQLFVSIDSFETLKKIVDERMKRIEEKALGIKASNVATSYANEQSLTDEQQVILTWAQSQTGNEQIETLLGQYHEAIKNNKKVKALAAINELIALRQSDQGGNKNK